MIRTGLIGYGEWGANHFRHFQTLPQSRLVAVCDSQPARLDEIRRILPSLAVTTEPDELLARQELDAVAIATPAGSHYALVRQAIEAGKDVLCEKPLTLKSQEAEELADLATRRGRILMVGHTFVYNTGIQKLRDYVREKLLGTLHYVYSARLNLGPVRPDVDVVWDLATHDVSILTYLLDSEPVEISATSGFFLQRPLGDVSFITLRYPNNVLASIHVSWIDPVKVRQITMVGSHKMIVWNDLSTTEPIRIYDKGIVHEPRYSNFGEFHYLTREGDVLIPRLNLVEPLRAQDTVFLECVERRTAPVSDGRFGLRIVRTVERIAAALAASSSRTPSGQPAR
ncbi:MAG: Gfo/Idh/MocA family oxidoreductase [Nitrospirae bacterium]|nr:Gfo/Idh/MocA family oxidoreductase [Nitrospirota bacterium]